MKHNQFDFIQPSFIEKEFCGKTLKFYAVPVKITPLLKNISEEVAEALSAFVNIARDDNNSRIEKRLTDTESHEIHDFGISPEVAKFRSSERAKAMKTLASSAFSSKHADLIAMIIMGSLRDLFPPDKEDTPKPEEFFSVFGDTLTHAHVAMLLKYSLEASAEVLSPFFSGCWDSLNGKLLEKLSGAWFTMVRSEEDAAAEEQSPQD